MAAAPAEDISEFVIPSGDAAGAAAAAPASKSAGNTGALVTAVLIFLVVVVIVYLMAAPQTLSAKLARQGWVLYVMPGCGYCKKQQRLLGTTRYPKKVVCVKRSPSGQAAIALEPSTLAETNAPLLCSRVQAYPFWINQRTGEVRKGLQGPRALQSMLA